ncbi:MAG TPA: hypothetical protein VH597_17795 [Verrucomicrobiae bacterium]|jgi:hypothetical protein|nr:hypothetical protein [Verrucomicrobiae bacterium]
MSLKNIPYRRLATILVCAAGLATARAASTLVTFSVDMATNIAAGTFVPGTDTIESHGTFNGWGALSLIQQGVSTIYTNTINDTTDTNGGKLEYKFVINGSNYENPATAQNRAARLPTDTGASLVLPTAFFGDAGAPVTNNIGFQVDASQQIALGNFHPGTDQLVVRGMLNGWAGNDFALTNDPSIARTNQFGLVTSNVWVGNFPVSGSPGGAQAYKYVLATTGGDNWDSPSPVNADGGGNRYFANVAQTLPVSDFSDAPFAPVATLTFSVDMSVVALTDTNYNSGTVVMWGDFNGWSGGLVMTNNPSAANTNIYTINAPISSGDGATINYQFRYNQFSTGNTVYDHLNGANGGNDNRHYAVVNTTNVAPVFFNDAELDDFLTQATPVFFSVDMTGAIGTDGHTFDPSQDNVYINGQFANWYAWASGINPASAPSGYQLIEQGQGNIYTNTIMIPAGTAVSFFYKYGIDEFAFNGGPGDNEAGFGLNHFRVVRSTATNLYMMPIDKFSNMYNEPFFSSGSPGGAHLSVGALSGSTVPVTWLGRPGAHLQVTTSIGGAWQDLMATDGATWVSGYNDPTNGFVSQTNWPTSGSAFFRLVKP